MARSSTSFKKGQSGNPGGKRKRILAEAIQQVGNAKNERDITNRKEVAIALWDIVRTKRFNDQPITLNDWMAVVEWLALHIDGPIPTEIGLEQSGEIIMRVVYENGRADGQA